MIAPEDGAWRRPGGAFKIFRKRSIGFKSFTKPFIFPSNFFQTISIYFLKFIFINGLWAE